MVKGVDPKEPKGDWILARFLMRFGPWTSEGRRCVRRGKGQGRFSSVQSVSTPVLKQVDAKTANYNMFLAQHLGTE